MRSCSTTRRTTSLVYQRRLVMSAMPRTYDRVMALPAPSWASSEGVRRSLRSNRPRDTRPEIELRSALHAAGLRFRKHYRPVPGIRCEVDVAFTRLRLAVQLDGCFWHGCPEHATRPVTNATWWSTKLDGTVARDRQNDALLRSHGWEVLRFWEHEPVDDIVGTIGEEVRRLRL